METLNALFAQADEIGNKYFTEEEIIEQKQVLFEAIEEVNATIEALGLDEEETVSSLFAQADAIADKYFSDDEIIERKQILFEAFEMVNATIDAMD